MMPKHGYTQYESTGESFITPAHDKHQNGFTYEHFPVVCPTCEGNGEIYEEPNGMVTFVPVKDKRLKPAWTKVKIALLLLVILIICGATTYFLYPRDVSIRVTAHEIKHFEFKTKYPRISYEFEIAVNNRNFFSVTINDIVMQLLYRRILVEKKSLNISIDVSLRAMKTALITMNVTYDTDTASYIRTECYINKYFVPQLMVSSGELNYWMHSEHIASKDDYFYMDCSNMVFPATTTKTTTTVATSTSTKTN